jgi:phage terminase small subunit
MTEAQKRFCDEYVIDFNGTRAYKAAYPNCKKDETAKAAASRLLTNVNVIQYIQEQKEELREKINITKEQVINQIARIAFGDIRKLYNENGGLKNIQDLDDDAAAIVAGIETTEEFDGYGEDREQIGYTKKVKIASKDKALDMLGKYFGIFTEKVEINSDKPFEVNINVKGSK